MKIVDVSGFMFSGKSAVSDILREFENIHTPNYLTEFDLLRIPGGLIDLKNAVMDWSPIRTYAAIIKFDQKVNQLASTPLFPVNLFKTGLGYSKIYPNIIHEKDEFIRKIKLLEWNCPWPYSDLDDDALATFKRKLLSKFYKIPKRDYCLANKDIFFEAANYFIEKLLISSEEKFTYTHYVTHNALEPFDPQLNIDLLGKDAKCIVVDRDPRDIYANAISYQKGYNPDPKYFSTIAGAHSVDIFINRYLIYRNNIKNDSKSVLRLKLEELIMDYDKALHKIYDFLNLDEKNHTNKLRHFDPEKSKKNINFYRKDEYKGYKSDFDLINYKCN